MRYVVCIFVLAAHALAAPTTIKLIGRVVDQSTDVGVPSASVRATVNGINQTATTGADGSFDFDLPAAGNVTVSSSAEGYSSLQAFKTIVAKPDSVDLTVTIPMIRSATIIGRIVDWETREPIANVQVVPAGISYRRGQRELFRRGLGTKSDSEGNFVLKDLFPAAYVLDVNALPYSAEPRGEPKEAYPRTYWPGGGDPSSSSPFVVVPGSTYNAGEIRLRKGDRPNLSIGVAGGNCAGQIHAVMMAEFTPATVSVYTVVKVPCNETVSLQRVSAGDFVLHSTSIWQPERKREAGAIRVHIAERDVAATLVITPPLVVQGQVIVDPKSDVPGGLRVRAVSRASRITREIAPIPPPDFTKVAGDGSFETSTYVPLGGELEVLIDELPAKYYVKALKYNGSVSPGSVFAINPQAAVQELQIVLSDKPASIYGTAGVDASVLLTRWPAELVSNYPYDFQETTTDPSGGFAFNRLPPGTYRVIAVPSAMRPILEAPGRMITLFNAAESVEVREGSGVLKALAPQTPR